MGSEIERLIDQSPDPHVIIDASGKYLHLNPAATAIIGNSEDPIGQSSPFSDSRSQEFHGRLRRTRIGWTAVEFTRMMFSTEPASDELVRFGLVHERSRRGRQLEAIVAVAAALSNADQIDAALDLLAREVRTAADLESCAITLLEPDRRVRIAGTSGLPDNYAQLLEACRQLGAPLLTVRSLEESRIIIDSEWRTNMLREAHWEPLHNTVRQLRIGTLIAAPIRVKDAAGNDDVLGALTVFCREDVELDHDDIAFLRAMADYAAIAISNARMYRRLRQQAAQEERLRLSRELHDSVTQELFSLSLRTRALTRHPEVFGSSTLEAEVESLHVQTRRALDQMRATIVRGRSIEIGPGGIVQALRDACAKLDLADDVSVTITAHDDSNRVPTDVQEDVFLLAMEAVRNAVKHAQAKVIEVELGRSIDDRATLRVTVSDDGTGFTPSQRSASAVGLDAMRERAQAHGGTLSITSTPGAGTQVTGLIPGVYPDGSDITRDIAHTTPQGEAL